MSPELAQPFESSHAVTCASGARRQSRRTLIAARQAAVDIVAVVVACSRADVPVRGLDWVGACCVSLAGLLQG